MDTPCKQMEKKEITQETLFEQVRNACVKSSNCESCVDRSTDEYGLLEFFGEDDQTYVYVIMYDHRDGCLRSISCQKEAYIKARNNQRYIGVIHYHRGIQRTFKMKEFIEDLFNVDKQENDPLEGLVRNEISEEELIDIFNLSLI